MNTHKIKLHILLLSALASLGSLLFAQETKITKRVMTGSALNEIKRKQGVFVPGKNYNVIINGHGTGLRPPTAEEWHQISKTAIVVDSLELAVVAPSSHDNSATKWFPPVGNQGSEGSCTTWAFGYYTKTFQEAYEHDWDLSGCEWDGQAPSPAYQNFIFSPDFIYHQINGGADNGSSDYDAMKLLSKIGCATWANMPYDPYNSSDWPDEVAWREAPLYRSLSFAYMEVNTDAALANLKQWLASPNLAVFILDANQYSNLNGEDLWTVNNYNPGGLNHANTVVGYDNNYGPYLENGNPNTYGAFKVANSWGTGGWEKVADGFYYISYQCFKEKIGMVDLYENWFDYNPQVVSVFQVQHDLREECKITVGIGDKNSPSSAKPLNEYMMNGGPQPFPANKMVLDITEFMPFMSGPPDNFFLKLAENGTAATGLLTHFSIEKYTDYQSGTPSEVFASSEPPLQTENFTNVYANIAVAGNTIHVAPAELVTTSASGLATLDVQCNGEPNMTWNAAVVNGSEWLSITSGVSGAGGGTIEIQFSENIGTAARTGKVQVTSAQAFNTPLAVTIIQNSAAQFTKVFLGNVVDDGGASVGCSWGDFDGDGILDLFVTNRNNENNFLYSYNIYFDDFSKNSTDIVVNDGGNSYSGSSADYDNDGDLDLFVANKGGNNFLYKNNGDGSFTKITSGAIVTDGGNATGCSWADYDNDGHLDLFVANDGENNFLYKNNDDGSFTKVTSGTIVTDGGASTSCSWADYDNDSKIDLFVTNYQQNNFLYHNNGNGTFTKITTGAIVTDGGASFGSSWQDYDNDGDLDLFVANDGENNFLYANDGDGSFTKIVSGEIVTDGGASFGSSWADIDNDGDADLFVANKNENNFLYLNNGDGNFTKIVNDVVANDLGASYGCAFADYDRDGDSDLFVANSDADNFLYINNGSNRNWIDIRCVGSSSNRSAIGAKVWVKTVIAGVSKWQLQEISAQTSGGYGGQNSLNAEFGLGDAVQIDSIRVVWPSGTIQTLKNVGVNQFLTIVEEDMFTKVTTGDIVNDDTGSNGCAWGDYDNDGYVDLFVANSGKNGLYKNNGDGAFTKITAGAIVNDGASSAAATWGDYDNDGHLDLFVANSGNDALYKNNGDGTFIKITQGVVVTDDAFSHAASWGDYDNDGDLDLFVAYSGQASQLYANDGSGNFSKVTNAGLATSDTEPYGCSWADYNNDGHLDLFVNNYYENDLYTNQGNGTFAQTYISDDNQGSSWGDFDNDGYLDLLLTYPIVLYVNNGNGSFTRNVLSYDESYGASWGDYDNDGDLDLFVATSIFANGGKNFLFKNNGDGSFTEDISSIITNDAGESRAAAWADIDNDGDLDLFVANATGKNFLYINNSKGKHWLNIECVGTVSNRTAIGAKVRVRATIQGESVWQLGEVSAQTGQASQNSLNLEFGLGDATIIETLKIEWPSGVVEEYQNLPADQFLTVIENGGVVPVELVSFEVKVVGSKVILNWCTATETDNYGFEVERKTEGHEFAKIAFVRGAGTTMQAHHYTLMDESLAASMTYWYRLKQIDLNGVYSYSDELAVEIAPPREFRLGQNYPNPFNPTTAIHYTLAEKVPVRLDIFNMLGQKLCTLVSETQEPGFYRVQWDGTDDSGLSLSSGIYIYRIHAGSFTATKKMLLLR